MATSPSARAGLAGLRHGMVLCSVQCVESVTASMRALSRTGRQTGFLLFSRNMRTETSSMRMSGLVFKATPSKTYTFSGEKCHGGKCSKERLSVLFCCNMDGSEKVRLLLIGKAKRPRALRQMQSLSVDWEANKKAWMTKDLFNAWLLKFDRKMAKEKRKVLLFLDNCSSHMQPHHLRQQNWRTFHLMRRWHCNQSTKVWFIPLRLRTGRALQSACFLICRRSGKRKLM